ncbi:MAG: glycosyltransferase family 2 protein [Gammaproteobacteria bacterium]|nr:glycosyltransferase family 2 protein [Gammaproteobacteria bacterium]
MTYPSIPVYAYIESTAVVVSTIIIAFGLLQNLIYTTHLAVAYWALRRKPPLSKLRQLWVRYSEVTMPISILVPAYNEEATVVDGVRALLALHYPVFDVIVVNDGSKDGTLSVLIEAFELRRIQRAYEEEVKHAPIRCIYGSPNHANLIVIDKENGGKSDALNAGINLSRRPLICSIDADSIVESDALLRAVHPFIDDPVRVVAVGGTVRVVNGCKVRRGRVLEPGLPTAILPLFQIVEYLRAFLIARIAWSELRALTLISGAFGIFRRQVTIAVGGYSHDTVGEDLELIIKIHRYMLDQRTDYLICFIPEPVCWTEVPSSLAVLGTQRMRWQRGALEVFVKHKQMLFDRRYGRVGALGLGNMLVVDVLGPPIELIGYMLIPALWGLGLISWPFLLAFLALAFIFGIFISVGALILEEIELRHVPRPIDLLILTGVAVLENFGYRQLNNIWRIAGCWQFLRGVEGWGTMTRTGFRRA